MYLEHISLLNSRIRLALKEGDSKTIFEATVELCSGNQIKADQLALWFQNVANSCKMNSNLTTDISMMRMWQLGNMDIKEVSNEGEPVFIFTYMGKEKVKETPKEKWFEVLLWEEQKQAA